MATPLPYVRSPPTKLLVAAYLGCRSCVRDSVDGATPELLDRAFREAVQGASSGRDTAWVQGYLAGKDAAQSSQRAECSRVHEAACSSEHANQPCRLFSAAHDGCRECVRRYIEEDGVDPREASHSGRNALLWALWGAANEKNTAWVQGYLEARGVTIPHNDTGRGGPEGLPEVLSPRELVRVFGTGATMP